MPVRTYMVVDDRHDHSFRIPRPDESVRSGAPNACNDCHKDKNAQWAASAVEGWHGPQRKGFQTYAPAFAAARGSSPDAARLLIAAANDRAAPALARATALSELSAHTSPAAIAAARANLSNADPWCASRRSNCWKHRPCSRSGPSPRHCSPIPSAACAFAPPRCSPPCPPTSNPRATGGRSRLAAGEFIAAQKLNADRPESRTGLGTFYLRQGRVAEAEAEYKAALRLSPQFAPAAVNLADLYRATNREADGLDALRTALAGLAAESRAASCTRPRAGALEDAAG